MEFNIFFNAVMAVELLYDWMDGWWVADGGRWADVCVGAVLRHVTYNAEGSPVYEKSMHVGMFRFEQQTNFCH